MLQKINDSNNSGNASRDQKKFHELLERIQLLKKLIEEKKELASKASQLRNEQLVPLMNQLRAVKLSQVRALDWAYDRNTLSKRLKIRLREEILDRINELLQNYPFNEEQEKEITAILARHSDSSAEELQETLQENKEEETREYLRFHYGIELDERESVDLNDPEVVEKIRAKIAEEKDRQNQRHTNTDGDERQTLKAKSLLDKLSKSLRSVYTSLVKHLHPDKEMDEEKKLQKTEAIKEVTQAYESKDMLALLILQSKYGIMEAIIEDSELRTYNAVLKKQVTDLETEHEQIIRATKGIPTSSASAMEKFFNSEKKNLKKHIQYEQNLLQSVFEEEDMLMQYLKQGEY